MERQLIEYDGCDDYPNGVSYYNVILLKDVGPYGIGTAFGSVFISLDNGYIELYEDDTDKVLGRYRLVLSVGEAIV